MRKVYLLLILTVACLGPLNAQVPTPEQQEQAQDYLAGRDIDQVELKRRLLERGINIDELGIEELQRVRPQIDAVIAEMEAEAARGQTPAQGAVQPPAAADPLNADGTPAEDAGAEEEKETEELPASDIYGHDVFRNKSLGVYSGAENATPPDSYPLRAGDRIAVSIFGTSQADLLLEIGSDGFIRPPRMPRIYLQGVSLGRARELLRNRFRSYYVFENGQFNVAMDVARTISVNIFGEVENNGTFSLSSLNTAFNALVASGGPTEIGSVRNIKLTSGDKVTNIDVYEFLQDPSSETDIFLTGNDLIYVPLAQKIVTLEGGVNREMKYELREEETLKDLLAFAGGVKVRAETSNITVTRYIDGRLEVIDVDLSEQPDFVLMNEDIVLVPVVEKPIENFVSVEGDVLLPGRYAFTPGLTLADVVKRSRLRTGARRDVGFLFRINDDGTTRLMRVDLGANAGAVEALELKRGDRLRVLAQSSFTDQAAFTIRGAIRDSSVTIPFPQDGSLNLEEAILLAGGTLPNAAPNVMIIRTPVYNSEVRTYERVNLSVAADTRLQPGDEVIVYARERYSDRNLVNVSGAIRFPGDYVYDPSLTLRDLLYLAGGPRLEADLGRIEVFRLDINKTNGLEVRTLVETFAIDENLDAVESTYVLQPFDQVVVRRSAGFEEIERVVIVGEVQYPGPYAIISDNEKLSDIIGRAGGLTPNAFVDGATLYRPTDDIGYVVLDLDEALEDKLHPANIVLRSQDTLFIPKKQELITIYTKNTLANRFGVDSIAQDGTIQVAYRGPKSANWYIDKYAGGFNDDTARKRWTTVEYASGQVKETKNILFFKNYPELQPGATIRVATAPPKQTKQRREERFDWLGLAQIVLGTATTLTTYILLRN